MRIELLLSLGGRPPNAPAPLDAERVGSLLSLDLPKTRAGAPPRGDPAEKMVGAHGLGPWTSSLSETRSNQLSYAPPLRLPRPPGNGTVQCGGLAVGEGRPARAEKRPRLLLPKEVIQPQVPLRLPCYDFIPVVDADLDASRRLRPVPTPMM